MSLTKPASFFWRLKNHCTRLPSTQAQMQAFKILSATPGNKEFTLRISPVAQYMSKSWAPVKALLWLELSIITTHQTPWTVAPSVDQTIPNYQSIADTPTPNMQLEASYNKSTCSSEQRLAMELLSSSVFLIDRPRQKDLDEKSKHLSPLQQHLMTYISSKT